MILPPLQRRGLKNWSAKTNVYFSVVIRAGVNVRA